MKRVAVTALAAASVLALCGTAFAQPLTLAEALGFAYETNPQLAAQQAELRATDENVAQANANWRPTINAQGQYGMQQFGFAPTTVSAGPPPVTISKLTEHPLEGELTVNQPIFRGGRTIAEVSRAKALVRSDRAQLLNTEELVLLQATTAYMDVVRDTAILQLRQQSVSLLAKQRDSTKAEFSAGALTRTDVAQSEARLAGAQSDLTAAQGQLAISRANFLQQIGRPAETLETNTVLPKIAGSEGDVIGLARRQYPLLIAARWAEKAAVYAIDDAYGALAPTVSVQGQYFYQQGSIESSVPGQLGGAEHGIAVLGMLNVPLYQGGAEYAAIRQAEEFHQQAVQNVDVENRTAEQDATSAWATFESAQATIQSNTATANADQIAFEGVQKEQQVGGRTILDVLNAQNELLNAQVAVVTSQRNTVVAAYQVLAASGMLTAKDLGLRVKLYDPLDHYDDDESRWIGFGG